MRIAPYMRLLLLAVVLAVGPLRAAPVLACAAMGGELRSACCCTEATAPPCSASEQHEQLPSPDRHCDCCELSFEAVDGVDGTTLTGGTLPEAPATGPPTEVSPLAPTECATASFHPPADDRSAATTYLLTARLRL